MKIEFNAKLIIVLLAILVIAAFFLVWDIYIDPPAFWRTKRQADKTAILNYVEKTYPNTIKSNGGKFPLQLPAGSFESSVMYFELDGINFSISAQDGKVNDDTYYEAKAEKCIRETFIDGFMNERELSPKIKISFVHNPDNYGLIRDYSLDNIHSFNGTIWVTITQDHIDGVYAPKDVGWFYDFYQYWMENCDLTNCVVYLHYRQNNEYSTNEKDYVVWFKRGKKTFSTENDFYMGFTA